MMEQWLDFHWGWWALAGLGLFFGTGWCWRWIHRKQRHGWYIRQASKVLQRLARFDGKGTAARQLAYLRHINPYVFEELVLLAFEKRGYRVVRNKRYSGDGGVDGQVLVNGKYIPVQSKRYRKHIKREHVEAFSLLVDRRKLPYGYFVHTGRTGKGSNSFQFPNVRFISGGQLIEWLLPTEEGRRG